MFQRVKMDWNNPTRLLQPNPIPISEWECEVISMEFITLFPKTSRQHDVIMVVVDKLSKANHFIVVL